MLHNNPHLHIIEHMKQQNILTKVGGVCFGYSCASMQFIMKHESLADFAKLDSLLQSSKLEEYKQNLLAVNNELDVINNYPKHLYLSIQKQVIHENESEIKAEALKKLLKRKEITDIKSTETDFFIQKYQNEFDDLCWEILMPIVEKKYEEALEQTQPPVLTDDKQLVLESKQFLQFIATYTRPNASKKAIPGQYIFNDFMKIFEREFPKAKFSIAKLCNFSGIYYQSELSTYFERLSDFIKKAKCDQLFFLQLIGFDHAILVIFDPTKDQFACIDINEPYKGLLPIKAVINEVTSAEDFGKDPVFSTQIFIVNKDQEKTQDAKRAVEAWKQDLDSKLLHDVVSKAKFVNSNRHSWLFVLTKEEKMNIAKQLLAHGAQANALDKRGNSVLRNAILDRNEELAALYIENGADIHVQDDKGNTALFYAIMVRSEYLVKFLLGKKSYLDITNKKGVNPLAIAAVFFEPAVMKQLLEAGCNPNMTIKGATLIDLAISTKNDEMLNLLLKNKADPNFVGTQKISSLSIAFQMNNHQAVKKLLDYKAKTDEFKFPLTDDHPCNTYLTLCHATHLVQINEAQKIIQEASQLILSAMENDCLKEGKGQKLLSLVRDLLELSLDNTLYQKNLNFDMCNVIFRVFEACRDYLNGKDEGMCVQDLKNNIMSMTNTMISQQPSLLLKSASLFFRLPTATLGSKKAFANTLLQVVIKDTVNLKYLV